MDRRGTHGRAILVLLLLTRCVLSAPALDWVTFPPMRVAIKTENYAELQVTTPVVDIGGKWFFAETPFRFKILKYESNDWLSRVYYATASLNGKEILSDDHTRGADHDGTHPFTSEELALFIYVRLVATGIAHDHKEFTVCFFKDTAAPETPALRGLDGARPIGGGAFVRPGADGRVMLRWLPAKDRGVAVGAEVGISGISGYRVEVDGSTACTVAKPPEAATEVSAAFVLADGRHRLRVAAVDQFGNTSYSLEREYLVDGQGPAAPAFLGLDPPPESAVTGSPCTARGALVFAWLAPTDRPEGEGLQAGSDPSRFDLLIRNEAGEERTFSQREVSGEWLREGCYSARVRAYDALGNAGEPSAEYAFRLDRSPPSTPTGFSAQRDLTDPWIFHLGWQPAAEPTADAWQGGVTGYEVRVELDTGGVLRAVSAEPRAAFHLPKGSHVAQVTARDAAGNTGEPARFPFVVSGYLAEVTFPADAVRRTESGYELHWNPAVTDPPSIGIAGYRVLIRRAAAPSPAAGEWSAAPVFTQTSCSLAGRPTKVPHRAYVTAIDREGNTSCAARAFTLPNEPPRFAPEGPLRVLGPGVGGAGESWPPGHWPSIGLDPWQDAEGDGLGLRLYLRREGEASYTPLPAGSLQFRRGEISAGECARAAGTFEWYLEVAELYDANGDPADGQETLYAPGIRRWPAEGTVRFQVVDPDPPLVGLPPEYTTTPGAPLLLSAEVRGWVPGSELTYHWDFGDGSPASAEAAPIHIFFQLGARPVSEYTVTLTVRDEWGHSSEPAHAAVRVINTREGTLRADELWSGEHELFATVRVPAGRTLTVLPGTRVRVTEGSGAALVVQGRLVVQGLAGPVSFLSAGAGGPRDWRGILVEGEASLEGAEVRHAERAVTVLTGAQARLAGCTLAGNRVGLHACGEGAAVEDCRFADNEWYGVKEDAIAANGGRRPRLLRCSFEGNGRPYYHEERLILDPAALNLLPGNAGNTDWEASP